MSAGLWGFPVDIGHDPFRRRSTQAHIGHDYCWELPSRLKAAHDMEQYLFIDDLKHSESMIDDKMNE